MQLVNVDDIDWLQASGNYVIIHIGSATLRTRESISDLENILEPGGFIRVHRSVLVNADNRGATVNISSCFAMVRR